MLSTTPNSTTDRTHALSSVDIHMTTYTEWLLASQDIHVCRLEYGMSQ